MRKSMVKSKSLMAKILEIITGGTVATVDIVTAILESGYGASNYKISRNLNKIEWKRFYRELEYKERQKFSNLISKLRSDGLISKSDVGWRITRPGIDKLSKIRKLRAKKVDLPTNIYKRQKGRNFTLVSFDIPEEYRGKRDWLREVLCDLGFKLLQKSVWIGKIRIPKEFLDDLRELKILNYIHIFSVRKLGTIYRDDGTED